MSVICSSVEQYSITTSFSDINSLILWNRISICSDRPWKTEFLPNAIADLLSQHIFVGLFCFKCITFKNLHIHTVWVAQQVAAIYYASAVESATTGCFFEYHEIALVSKWNAYPDVFILVSISSTKSLLCIQQAPHHYYWHKKYLWSAYLWYNEQSP